MVAVDAVGGPHAAEDGWGGEVEAHRVVLGSRGVLACAHWFDQRELLPKFVAKVESAWPLEVGDREEVAPAGEGPGGLPVACTGSTLAALGDQRAQLHTLDTHPLLHENCSGGAGETTGLLKGLKGQAVAEPDMGQKWSHLAATTLGGR